MRVRQRFTGKQGKAHWWRGDYEQFLKDVLEPGEILTCKEHPAPWGRWVVRTDDGFAYYRPFLFNMLWTAQAGVAKQSEADPATHAPVQTIVSPYDGYGW